MAEKCVICKLGFNNKFDVVTLGDKGCKGIFQAAINRGSPLQVEPGSKVHKKCRKDYCRPTSIVAECAVVEEPLSTSRSLRSANFTFEFSKDCFFCGTSISNESKRKCSDIFEVTTLELKETILGICDNRKDDWANAVRARIYNVHDLPAADAKYHQMCSVNFRTNKGLPHCYQHKKIEKNINQEGPGKMLN